ncbi:hypothetical protein GE21DRAFT_9814 [Neurospora crassa]|uniref:pH-response transcription factor pacC/RIM101 n=1 Tax=Neurospora crassa (strain ATCC 24698 / 74-OR23-1A / CBS 708.71 / DSM 1257 / FGSC 987) TaxID=367110 RepID=V5IKT3_NEUCR|nr:hypothetical protein NCU06907 [Neurospora crassa OR74A]XP_011395257.1 uncharacterized protein NCU06907 [Neurospora crassa OR74A]ESA41834.1 hypothetical protein NCU06907 [Neurospora crassa OR74A]ESA41835.1 hypothetical protein, variant 1 [Neurospora crassa OR74A]KHE82586.1 hypothetical protein GE21DRAFT_9814 [Neurospora crassa]|eukprot:XP_011395256.1 hypothetical protein NCU06907 [Neurospora crassa OR74A]
MMSNPPLSGVTRPRQRLHRRQNSTPSAFEAVKIAPLPTFPQQQHQRPHMGHRRGVSLDTRRHPLMSSTITTTSHQDYSTLVSTTGPDTGIPTSLPAAPQDILAQQQHQAHLIARPSSSQTDYSDLSSDSGDSFLLSPHGTPHQRNHFMDGLASQGPIPELSLSYDTYIDPNFDAMMKRNQVSYDSNNNNVMASSSSATPNFDFFASDAALSTPNFMSFPDQSPAGTGQGGWISEGEASNIQLRRASRRVSVGLNNSLIDKLAKYEPMANGQRPETPPMHNAAGKHAGSDVLGGNTEDEAGFYPPTPMETPHDRFMKQQATQQQQHQQQQQQQQTLRPSRFADDYDESMEETLKPIRGHRSNRNSGIFQELRQQAEAMAAAAPATSQADSMPTTFQSHTLPAAQDEDLLRIHSDFIKLEHGFTFPDMGSQMGPQIGSQMQGLGGMSPFDNKPDLGPPSEYGDADPQAASRQSSVSPSRRGSPHRRTDSIASIASAASIASINIEETKTETGVTLDDIAQYIEGPDPADGKWVCTYEDCRKRFGRKENIKSHVQTHLNDRQYQCPTCKKCFVRQHDLKRHAKIHTGIKPYPCECGNSFARHDALTRHRQRGMCVGAFDGIVRKVVKRGRPRKNRPDMEERKDKSDRTRDRSRSHHSTSSSVSSFSGYSDSSVPNSPGNDYDHIIDDEQFPGLLDMPMGNVPNLPPSIVSGHAGHGHGAMPSSSTMNPAAATMSVSSVSSAPMPSFDPRVNEVMNVDSPASRNYAHSPSAVSNYSHASHPSISITEHHGPGSDFGLPGSQNAASPAKSAVSHYTPPELSSSSSPPTHTQQQQGSQGPTYYDLDPSHGGMSNIPGPATSMGMGAAVGPTHVDPTNMLLHGYEHQMDQNLMLGNLDGMTKFEVMEGYDAATEVNMFGDAHEGDGSGHDGSNMYFGS